MKKTDDPNIYAVGDVEGDPMLAHKAFRDAVMVVDDIVGRDTSSYYNIPKIVFTDPQFAKVGVSPSESGSNQKVGKAYFRAVGASHTKNEPEGFARIVVDQDDGIVGADVVGPQASELIHGFGILVENDLTIEDAINSVIGYPTLSEIITKAAEDVDDLPPNSL